MCKLILIKINLQQKKQLSSSLYASLQIQGIVVKQNGSFVGIETNEY